MKPLYIDPKECD